jgi:hypothetical protein
MIEQNKPSKKRRMNLGTHVLQKGIGQFKSEKTKTMNRKLMRKETSG